MPKKLSPMDKVLAAHGDLTELKQRALVRQYDDPEMDVYTSLGNWNTPRPSSQASAVTAGLIETFGQHWVYDEDLKEAHAAFLSEERDPRSLAAEQEARNAREPWDDDFNTGFSEDDNDTGEDIGIDSLWFLDPVTGEEREFSKNPTVEVRDEVYDLGWVGGPIYSDSWLQEKARYATELYQTLGWKMPIPIPGNIPAPPEATAKDLPRCQCGRFLDKETQACWKSSLPPTVCDLEPWSAVLARMAEKD